MEKFFYFRNVSAIADDDGIENSVAYAVSSLIGMFPSSDTALTMTFKNVQRPEGHGNSLVLDNAANLPLVDTIVLTTGTNKAKEAMRAIVDKMHEPVGRDNGFIVIADNVASEYVSGDVSGVTITHNAAYVNA